MATLWLPGRCYCLCDSITLSKTEGQAHSEINYPGFPPTFLSRELAAHAMLPITRSEEPDQHQSNIYFHLNPQQHRADAMTRVIICI